MQTFVNHASFFHSSIQHLTSRNEEDSVSCLNFVTYLQLTYKEMLAPTHMLFAYLKYSHTKRL